MIDDSQMRNPSFILLFLPLLLAFWMTRAEKPLRVVASTTLIADVARQVAGDQAEVSSLAGAQSDPHAFDPTPSQMRGVLEADLVMLNGAGLEIGLEKALRDAGAGARLVSVSTGLKLRTGEPCDHDHDHSAHAHHDHESQDPHVWFDPILVQGWASNITRTLTAARPVGKAGFEARRDAYVQQLAELHTWILAQVAVIPAADRKIVSDHAFLGYFTDRYNFDYAGSLMPGTSTLSQPSAKRMAETIGILKQARITALFVEAGSSHPLATRIAADAGARLVPLHSCSLGAPGGGVDTYLGFMRHNVGEIVKALQRGQP